MAPYSVQIAGSSVYVVAGSLSIDSSIGKRSTAAFAMHLTSIIHYQQDQQVVIYDNNGVLAFSGYITAPKEQQPGFQPTLNVSVTCADKHRLADKRVIAKTYVNKTCGFIVQDLVTSVLAAEGVTVGSIYDGQTPSTTLYPSLTLYPGGNIGLIPAATFVYCTVAAALDALAKAASSSGVPYYWMIDQFGALYFVPYTSIVNSTVVDGTKIDAVNSPPTVTRANPLYRNTQYILGGVAQTVTQNETRIGDGSTTTWTMNFALSSVPTITVGGVAKTVGIQGVDTGKDFYWNAGSQIITQDSSAAKLTNANTLAVTYIGQYPSVIISSNSAQIAYEAALDATTGIVEEVETDNTLANVSNGLTEASQLLTLYAVQGLILTFSTLVGTYAPGQLITVNLPNFGLINAQLLISDVSASDQTDGFNIWYSITAVQGPYNVSWVDFFSKMLVQQAPANSINVGVSQSTTILAQFNMSVAVTASFTGTVYACPVVNTTLFPSLTLFPC